jgi:hypothetical protein
MRISSWKRRRRQSRSVSGSVALPQITRLGPSWIMSPSLVTRAAAGSGSMAPARAHRQRSLREPQSSRQRLCSVAWLVRKIREEVVTPFPACVHLKRLGHRVLRATRVHNAPDASSDGFVARSGPAPALPLRADGSGGGAQSLRGLGDDILNFSTGVARRLLQAFGRKTLRPGLLCDRRSNAVRQIRHPLGHVSCDYAGPRL